MAGTGRKRLQLTIVLELLILLMITGCDKKDLEEYDYYRFAYMGETTVLPDISSYSWMAVKESYQYQPKTT